MKIDNLDKSRQLIPKPAEKAGSRTDQPEFAQVLQKTVQTNEGERAAPRSMAAALRPVDFTARPEATAMAARQTGEILDTLETYQQLLANPSKNLRTMQPVLEQLGHEADDMTATMRHLPQGHVLRTIMKETLIQVNQEIERFNQGKYI